MNSSNQSQLSDQGTTFEEMEAIERRKIAEKMRANIGKGSTSKDRMHGSKKVIGGDSRHIDRLGPITHLK